MSDYNDNTPEEPQEEIWVTKDGTKIPVGDLTEAHAKNILRMILRERRLDQEHFENVIMPSLADVISAIEGMADDMPEGPFVIVDPKPKEPSLGMDDIDNLFVKHGAAIPKKPH